jgi:hypothetical protein
MRWLRTSPAVADCLQVAIGNRAKSGGSNLAGTAAREDVRPVQRTLVLPDLTGCSLSSVDLAWVLALT